MQFWCDGEARSYMNLRRKKRFRMTLVKGKAEFQTKSGRSFSLLPFPLTLRARCYTAPRSGGLLQGAA